MGLEEMKIYNLDKMVKGWFIGDFEPSLYKTDDCEIAVKYYKEGDYEGKHYHKIATEYTVVVSGVVKMFDKEYAKGSIIVVEPGEITDFYAVSDCINVVVKIPCENGDKYTV